MNSTRRGALLIIVAGLSAIMAAMTFAFLLRARSDAEETVAMMKDTQARIMLGAGLQYISESARLGWHVPGSSSPGKDEAFGWIDVRDGRPGPLNQFGEQMFVGDAITGTGPRFPAVDGKAARCPMYAVERPPFAVTTKVLNPVKQDPALSWRELLGNQVPMPQPISADLAAFNAGDLTPRANTVGRAWFRVFRTSKGAEKRLATFIITCGAGETLGFKDWAEVVSEGMESSFVSESDFKELRLHERLLWYEVEWTPNVNHNTVYHTDQRAWTVPYTDWNTFYMGLHELGAPQMLGRDTPNTRQFGGTFLYIERRVTEPVEGW